MRGIGGILSVLPPPQPPGVPPAAGGRSAAHVNAPALSSAAPSVTRAVTAGADRAGTGSSANRLTLSSIVAEFIRFSLLPAGSPRQAEHDWPACDGACDELGADGSMAERVGVHLLGAPFVTWGDVLRPGPRGHKAWGLLAYLLATAPSRRRQWLAELLFSEAEDPLNALSWSLSQLRRLLGPGTAVSGDPVELKLTAGSFVDIRALTLGTWIQALGIPGLGH